MSKPIVPQFVMIGGIITIHDKTVKCVRVPKNSDVSDCDLCEFDGKEKYCRHVQCTDERADGEYVIFELVMTPKKKANG